MSFLRHEEIYPLMRARPRTTAPPAHRLDEFPAGYSLAGCAPAEPASASPAGHDGKRRKLAVQRFCSERRKVSKLVVLAEGPTASRGFELPLGPDCHGNHSKAVPDAARSIG